MLLVLACVSMIAVSAQENYETTNRTTVYDTFRPSVITLANGKIIKQNRTNIFLKNGALLYLNGKNNMQADMSKISSVDFGDRRYIRIDTLLAYVVDTVCGNSLLCATLIDLEAYRHQMLNNRQITNMEIQTQVSITTLTPSDDDDVQYPLVNLFFYEIGGKFVKVHERTIGNMLPKDKRRIFKSVIMAPEFSWTDKESLMRLLKAIS